MQTLPHKLLLTLSAIVSIAADAATGPVVNGPEFVATSEMYSITLDPGSLVSGSWTINWGDGSSSIVPVSQTSATRSFAQPGVYQVSATLKNGTGGSIETQQAYTPLVLKTKPALYYNFNDGVGTEHVGPPHTRQGAVTTVKSFAGSTGDAVRLAGAGYLRLAGHSMKDSDFFGIEFWARPNNITSRQVVFGGVGTADGNVLVYIEQGNLCFELRGSGVKSIPLGSDVQPGRWYQFGVSFERSPYFKERNQLRFYRDGQLYAEHTFSAALSRPVAYTGATIGAHDTGNASMMNYFNGDIDEVVLHPLGVFPGAFLERYRAATTNQCNWRVAVCADGAAQFTVQEPTISGEKTVQLTPDDRTKDSANFNALKGAITSLVSGQRLKIVGPSDSVGRTYYLGRYDTNDMGIILALWSRQNIEIDGGGAKFLITTPYKCFIMIDGGDRIALRNMSFDIDPVVNRVGTYARVLNVDAVSGNLEIQYVKGAALVPDMTVSNDVNIWRWRRIDRQTRALVGDGFIEPTFVSKTVQADTSRWVYKFSDSSTSSIWSRFTAIKNENALLQLNNARFFKTAFQFGSGVKNLTLDRLHLYGALGMGYHIGHFDYVRMVNCRIGLPPGETVEDRPLATGSDGIQVFQGATGHFIFEGNDIAMTDDDPISLKSPVYRGSKKVDANQLEVPKDSTLADFLMPEVLANGTTIQVRKSNLDPLGPGDEGIFKVTAYNSLTRIVTLNKPLPGAINDGYCVMNEAKPMTNWVLRGNNFHDLNGRFLIYTRDGTFENNRARGMYFHIGFAASNVDVAGQPYNILVRNNYIQGNLVDTGCWETYPTVPVIEDISFVNNSFIGSRWGFDRTTRLNMMNNYMEGVSTTLGAVSVTKSSGIDVVGNSHYDPKSSVFIGKDVQSVVDAADNEEIRKRGVASDIIVDNSSAVYAGTWSTSSWNSGQFFGTDYRTASGSGAVARFTPLLSETGGYRVYAMWNSGADRGATVSYTVTHANGTATVTRSHRTGGGLWVYLGTYTFNSGSAGNVTVSSTGAGGIVVADAVRFQR